MRVSELSQRFGALAVLDRVSLSLDEGDFVSIVGPSGCGKTVLLRVLAGLQTPTAGGVQLRAAPVAYAFQKSPLFPWLSLLENVRLCVGADAGSLEKIDRYFTLAGLSSFRNMLPGKISVGMRQKVNVIRAFSSGRPVILMDEPFVSLDFPSRRELQELTLELWGRERKTILFVTHDVDEALLLSQRVLVFSPRPGHVVRDFPLYLPYPRDPQAVRSSAEYINGFREISGLLLAGRGGRA